MGTEIERKFLVVGDGWRPGPPGVLVRQGYLAQSPTCTVRVRVAGDEAYLTIKGETTGISRREYEYPIPAEEANEMLDVLCPKPLIEKVRHYRDFGGLRWEIDEFLGENAGLILAEVELESEDREITLPDWAGADVSDDPRYYNVNLARMPYTKW
jgi:CYTH domain-containing protein